MDNSDVLVLSFKTLIWSATRNTHRECAAFIINGLAFEQPLSALHGEFHAVFNNSHPRFLLYYNH